MLQRSEAVRIILETLESNDVAFFATGMISREAFAFLDRKENFYIIGSMGLVSSLALGVALAQPNKTVIVVDGDGSVLMDMGTLAQVGNLKPRNFLHVVLDNESYESTGNQPSISRDTDLARVAKAAGYPTAKRLSLGRRLKRLLQQRETLEKPAFLLVKVDMMGIPGIGRVALAPDEMTRRLRSALGERRGCS
jgi:thiamine pyrophosphate-dependent acetolactate synthase large subunit-like protein